MTIYPAIDIKGGRCVRLLQGRADQETVYGDDPVEVAREFQRAGTAWVHVVDLDGAFRGQPANLPIVEKIARLGLRVQLGGGLRTRENVAAALEAGAARIVLGTRATESEAFVGELVAAFGDRIAVGIDARNGQVAVKGWVEETKLTATALARRMDALGIATLIHTDIGTDGMLTGPNFAAQSAMLAVGKFRVIASGGVSTREDVEKLAALAAREPRLDGVIVGKALYEKRVELGDLLRLAAAGS